MSTTISRANPGDRFKTGKKVVCEEEMDRFCEITLNTLPFFLSDEAARAKGWEKRLVPGVFTLSCTIGLMEQAGLLDDVIAFMAMDNLRYLAPVYLGDSLYVEVEYTGKKSIKQGTRNLITYRFTTYNQNDNAVLEAVNT